MCALHFWQKAEKKSGGCKYDFIYFYKHLSVGDAEETNKN